MGWGISVLFREQSCEDTFKIVRCSEVLLGEKNKDLRELRDWAVWEMVVQR